LSSTSARALPGGWRGCARHCVPADVVDPPQVGDSGEGIDRGGSRATACVPASPGCHLAD
jgi:hypothetical protein